DAGCRSAGIGCIDCKKWLNSALLQRLEPIWERRAQYVNNTALIKGVAEAGAKRAHEVALSVLEEARDAIGF
ncbi:MAG TPA: tryptophan--tRNA ligase, partial [Nitrospirota bacterium]